MSGGLRKNALIALTSLGLIGCTSEKISENPPQTPIVLEQKQEEIKPELKQILLRQMFNSQNIIPETKFIAESVLEEEKQSVNEGDYWRSDGTKGNYYDDLPKRLSDTEDRVHSIKPIITWLIEQKNQRIRVPQELNDEFIERQMRERVPIAKHFLETYTPLKLFMMKEQAMHELDKTSKGWRKNYLAGKRSVPRIIDLWVTEGIGELAEDVEYLTKKEFVKKFFKGMSTSQMAKNMRSCERAYFNYQDFLSKPRIVTLAEQRTPPPSADGTTYDEFLAKIADEDKPKKAREHMFGFHMPKPTPPIPPIPEPTKEELEEITIRIAETQEKEAPKPSLQAYQGSNGESWSRYAIKKPPKNFYTISAKTNTLEKRIKKYLEDALLTDNLLKIYYHSIKINLVDEKSLTKIIKKTYYFAKQSNKEQFKESLQIPCIPQYLISEEFTHDLYVIIKNRTLQRTVLEKTISEICASANNDEFEGFKKIFLNKYQELFNPQIKLKKEKLTKKLRPQYIGPKGERWLSHTPKSPPQNFHTVSEFQGQLSKEELSKKIEKRNEIIKQQKKPPVKALFKRPRFKISGPNGESWSDFAIGPPPASYHTKSKWLAKSPEANAEHARRDNETRFQGFDSIADALKIHIARNRAKLESRIYESEKELIVADQESIDLVTYMFRLAKTNNFDKFSERILKNEKQFPIIMNRILDEHMLIRSFTKDTVRYLYDSFQSGTLVGTVQSGISDTGLGIEVNIKLEQDKGDFETLALIVSKKRKNGKLGKTSLVGLSVDESTQEMGMWDLADYINPEQAEQIVSEIIKLAKTSKQSEFEKRTELGKTNLPKIRKYEYQNPKPLTKEKRDELYTLLQTQEVVEKMMWTADTGRGAEVLIDFNDSKLDELKLIVYKGNITGYSTRSLIFVNPRDTRKLLKKAQESSQNRDYATFYYLFKQNAETLPSIIDFETVDRVNPRPITEELIHHLYESFSILNSELKITTRNQDSGYGIEQHVENKFISGEVEGITFILRADKDDENFPKIVGVYLEDVAPSLGNWYEKPKVK